MSYRKKFLKEASVLLIVTVMIFSSATSLANTNNYTKVDTATVKNAINPNSLSVNNGIVWDNVVGVHGSLGGVIVSTVRNVGIAFPADDFKLNAACEVDKVFWQGGYFQCQLGEGEKDYHWDWRIIFWDDCGDETHPGNEIYNVTYSDSVITREFWYNYTRPDNGNTYWVANYSVDLQPTYSFAANTKYWITIQGMQRTISFPQACWSRHNESVGGILLHQAVIKAAYWGYPSWTDISVVVTDKLPHDLNYQLYGPFENNPPKYPAINGPTEVKRNVKTEYTLNAVDPENDNLYYYVEWGDGNVSGWVGPSASGIDVILNHTWTVKGSYIIKAKAKDVWGAESNLTTLEITVPRTKSIENILQQLLKRFSNALMIIKQILP